MVQRRNAEGLRLSAALAPMLASLADGPLSIIGTTVEFRLTRNPQRLRQARELGDAVTIGVAANRSVQYQTLPPSRAANGCIVAVQQFRSRGTGNAL